MPIYEYQCEACSDIVEAMQKMSDEPMKTCPKCSGALKKLISSNSFQLKGGGWYSDGYNTSSANCDSSAGCPAANSSSASSTPSCANSSPCKCS